MQGWEKRGRSISASEPPLLGLWPTGSPRHQRSIPFSASLGEATSCWWKATSWWEGVHETLSCPSLCSTNHTLFFIPLPALAGCPLSISCHIFPVLQTIREKSPARPFAKPGRKTGHFPECFEPGPSQGLAGQSLGGYEGVQRQSLGGCEGGHLDRMPTSMFGSTPSHLTFPLGERICGPYSSHPVLKASSKARGTTMPFGSRDSGLDCTPIFTWGVTCVVFPVVKG